MNSLTLDDRYRQPSIFSIVHEYVNPLHVHHIKQSANRTTPLKNLYPSDYYFLEEYTYNYCSGLNCFVTEFSMHGEWGRLYPKGTSMSICHRPTRHTLCGDYVDFDMKNCQYEIVLDLMKKFHFKHDNVAEYCKNPGHYRSVLNKQDFLKALNGGFVEEPFLAAIQEEIKPLAKAVREQNPHMIVKENTPNSFFSYYLQTIERYLQESAVKELCEKYGIPIHEVIPCQDGFMIRKKYYEEGMMPSGNWMIKPMDESYAWKYSDIPYLPFDLDMYGDAEFARLLSHVNKLDDLISTGQDKFLEAYQFDVYWKRLPMNNAIFQQGCFEKLRDWCNRKLGLFLSASSNVSVDEKELTLLQKQFTKKKQSYESTMNEPYPKQFQYDVNQNTVIQKYKKSLCEQKQRLKKLSMCKERENIIQTLLKQVYKPSIDWNSDPYLFAFENCIFDIQAKKQVTPSREQYINQGCGYAFDPTYDMSRVDDLNILIQSILPNPEVRAFWMAKQATSLTQEHPQYLFIQTGSGSNGKSILTDLTQYTLGEYGYKLPSTFLQKPFKEGANPEVANLRNKRGVWCSEPQADMRLSASTIKELTGDASINGRGLYQSNCDIRLTGTLSLDANTIPNIDLVEFAMDRRLRPIPFNTKAVSQADFDKAVDKTNLVVKQEKYVSVKWKQENKQALFLILMQNYSSFCFDNLPKECQDRKLAFLNASSDIYGFVQEIYTECDPETSEPIKLKDVYEEFKNSSVFRAFKKGQQRELNYSKFCDKIRNEPAFSRLIKNRKEYHNGKQLTVDCLIGYAKECEEIAMI